MADGTAAADAPPMSPAVWPQAIEQVRNLAQAGLPLPTALRQAAATDPSATARRQFEELAGQVEAGVPLHEAIGASSLPLRDPLAAALEAGSATGDIWSVLRPLVETARISEDLRRKYRRTMGYYVVCFLIGAGLLTFVLVRTWAAVRPSAESLVVDSRGAAGFATSSDWGSLGWGGVMLLAPAALMLLLAVDFVIRLRRPDRLPLDFLPPMRGLAERLGWYRWAAVLETLVRAGVPLPDGLRLAGRSAMHGRVEAASAALATSAEQGQPLVPTGDSMPLLLRALLHASGGETPGPDDSTDRATPAPISKGTSSSLPDTLRAAADLLAESIAIRSDRAAGVLRLLAVGLMALGLLGYCLLVFTPLRQLVEALAQPI